MLVTVRKRPPCFFWTTILSSPAQGKATATEAFVCVPLISISAGVQRVHHPCDEPAAGTVAHAAHLAQGDRAYGGHHPPQVQLHPDAAEAEHLRSCHDPALKIP